MSREAAVLLARKLKALAEHPDTPGPEADNARGKLATLRERWDLTDEELRESVVQAGYWQAPVGDPAWAAWLAKAQEVINMDGSLDIKALRDLVDEIPDPTLRRRFRIALTGIQLVVDLLGPHKK